MGGFEYVVNKLSSICAVNIDTPENRDRENRRKKSMHCHWWQLMTVFRVLFMKIKRIYRKRVYRCAKGVNSIYKEIKMQNK